MTKKQHKEIDFEIVRQEIEEGDLCVCNFHDCALKFWFKRDQILKTITVQKLTSTPNLLRFEGVDNDEGFYANSFYKIQIANP